MRRTLCRLLAAAALAASPAPTPGAAPAPAPAKDTSPLDAARRALDEVGDFNYQNKSLNEVVADLKERTKLAVTIDPTAYQFGLAPDQPNVNVNLKRAKLKDAVRQALAPFNLRCGLTRDGLFISTEDGLTSRQLRQRVSIDCDRTPFSTAAGQLAADTGANVVIDPRLKEKAAAAVTLKLDDVPLEVAVRLLAEVADLGTVRMSNVLFVTTPERAEKMHGDGPTQPNGTLVPFPAMPGLPGAPGAIPGGLPGVAVPGGVAPAAAPVEEKKDAPASAPASEKKPTAPPRKPLPPPPGGLAPPPPGAVPGSLPPPPPVVPAGGVPPGALPPPPPPAPPGTLPPPRPPGPSPSAD